MPWSFKSVTASNGGMTLPFRRKRYTINEPDPAYQVVYLGNVLTVMAKGEGCVDKPMALIWKTHLARQRPDLHMRLSVTRSGLKAETKLQGLTEYWAHRITHCVAPTQYTRVFCWIYKHEGKKLKPELRCHAVLCRKCTDPPTIALRLHATLDAALREYKREKLSRQNTRLSATLACGYPSLPRRKMLLSTGVQNFRPPLSRSKSAPRLGIIEEANSEEEREDDEVRRESLLLEEEDEEIGEEARVEQLIAPGTPRELEFARLVQLGGGRCGPLLAVDLDKLRLDDAEKVLHLRTRSKSLQETEPDSISDESGYHEEKSSLEEDDDDYESDGVEVTSL